MRFLVSEEQTATHYDKIAARYTSVAGKVAGKTVESTGGGFAWKKLDNQYRPLRGDFSGARSFRMRRDSQTLRHEPAFRKLEDSLGE